MTDNTQPNHEELTAELDRLRQKNAELLDELKRAKAKSNDSSGELETLRAEVRSLRLDKPLDAMLADLFVVSPRLARAELEEDFSFELDEAGDIVVLNKEGERVTVEDPPEQGHIRGKQRPIGFNRDDLRKVLAETGKWDRILIGTRATGGGASAQPYRGQTTTAAPAGEPQPAKAGFGLR
ncbi:hypothetical protein LGR51_01035 [Pseudomonas sp. NP21570]|nr:hypothetical protein [Pseudomonas sp. NP21570]CEG53044.1 hypothetical protein PXNS11_280008 [Stutzerimonas xanthomarina]